MIAAANDATDPTPLSPYRCGLCVHWLPGWTSATWLGMCAVRPGVINIWTSDNVACDVANGRAFKPLPGVA